MKLSVVLTAQRMIDVDTDDVHFRGRTVESIKAEFLASFEDDLGLLLFLEDKAKVAIDVQLVG